MSEEDELARLRAENERLRRELADLEGLRELIKPLTDYAVKFMQKLHESKLKPPTSEEQQERELAEMMLGQLDSYQGPPEGRLEVFIGAQRWAKAEALTDAARDVERLVANYARSDADERYKAGAKDIAWDIELALYDRLPFDQAEKDRVITRLRELRGRTQ